MITPSFIIEFIRDNITINYRLVADGQELVMKSPFCNDPREKFSINTQTGLWQDFVMHEVGNLYTLMSKVLGITTKEAYYRVMYKALESGELFSENPKEREEAQKYFYTEKEFCEKFECLPLDKALSALYYAAQKAASEELIAYYKAITRFMEDHKIGKTFKSRILDADVPYFFGIKGTFKNRIIIPYYAANRKIFYFQARTIDGFSDVKYLNYRGIKAGSILYPFNLDDPYVIISEGPRDAIALQKANYNATCLGGCHITRDQINLLISFGKDIYLALDNDEAGKAATTQVYNSLKFAGVPDEKIKVYHYTSSIKDFASVKELKDDILTRFVDYYTYYLFQELEALPNSVQLDKKQG